jgi:hypothetical protein
MKQVNMQNNDLQALARATHPTTLPTVHDNVAIEYPAVDVHTTAFVANSAFSSSLLSDLRMHLIMQDNQYGRCVET